MKKLVFMFVAMAAMTFAACGGNKSQEAAPVEEEAVVEEVVDSVAADSVVADSTVADSTVAVAE